MKQLLLASISPFILPSITGPSRDWFKITPRPSLDLIIAGRRPGAMKPDVLLRSIRKQFEKDRDYPHADIYYPNISGCDYSALKFPESKAAPPITVDMMLKVYNDLRGKI